MLLFSGLLIRSVFGVYFRLFIVGIPLLFVYGLTGVLGSFIVFCVRLICYMISISYCCILVLLNVVNCCIMFTVWFTL